MPLQERLTPRLLPPKSCPQRGREEARGERLDRPWSRLGVGKPRSPAVRREREKVEAGRGEERERHIRETRRETDLMGVERHSQMGERWRGRPGEGAE